MRGKYEKYGKNLQMVVVKSFKGESWRKVCSVDSMQNVCRLGSLSNVLKVSHDDLFVD
jgi:hypothetical protein